MYGFGNSTAEDWVQTLLHKHYSTYVITDDGEIVLNSTVVKDKEVTSDGAGNKTYTLRIHDDLKWSNGEAITAEDYVFTLLWHASKEWNDAGAASDIGTGLLGYTEYHQGSTDRFPGVQLMDEYTFSLTIAADRLPYFHETKYVAVYPSYQKGWSPASQIDSSPDGAKLSADNADWTLAQDMEQIVQKELNAPTVTSGPFTFESFQEDSITLKANPRFKGDYKGQKPQLDTIIIKDISSQSDVESCVNGDIDAVTGVTEADKIDLAQADTTIDTNYYHVNFFAGLNFHCDFGPTQHKEVRRAMAHLINRQELIDQIWYGHASIVNSMYSLDQWMYIENKDTIDALPEFTLDVTKANDLLDQSPYKFEADGETPFDPAKADNQADYHRHNDQGEELTINHLDTEDGGTIVSPLAAQLQETAPQAGIDWQMDRTDFNTLLNHYNEGHLMPEGQRRYHSFQLVTGFTEEFDPYLLYHTNMLDEFNSQRLSDPELDEIMVNMRSLDPEQREEFLAEWVKFQSRWNVLLPTVPTYSSHNYDVYHKDVQGYRNTPFVSWADLICEISK